MKVCAIVYICEHIKPTEEVEFEEKTEYKEEKIKKKCAILSMNHHAMNSCVFTENRYFCRLFYI